MKRCVRRTGYWVCLSVRLFDHCAGIEAQIERLGEIEALQEEWQVQAEAQDEVERLLRAAP